MVFRVGPVGALMDEYERAADELKSIVVQIAQNDYDFILHPDEPDPDCHSIKNIMNHVVMAGYGYANLIRKQFGNAWQERKTSYPVDSPELACSELNLMMGHTLKTLEDKWDITEQQVLATSMKFSNGQAYDFEQLMEHAIVHILRHRRQIERFLRELGRR